VQNPDLYHKDISRMSVAFCCSAVRSIVIYFSYYFNCQCYKLLPVKFTAHHNKHDVYGTLVVQHMISLVIHVTEACLSHAYIKLCIGRHPKTLLFRPTVLALRGTEVVWASGRISAPYKQHNDALGGADDNPLIPHPLLISSETGLQITNETQWIA
jgi:hypothetical protein